MKILILHKKFIVGGVERVLFSYLKIFHQLNYNIELLVTYDLASNNIFFDNIPDNVQVSFIFQHHHVKRINDIAKRKSSCFYYFLNKYLKIKEKILFDKVIKEKLASDYDLIIDFNDNLNSFIKKGHLNIKQAHVPLIRWEHGHLNVIANQTNKKIHYFRHVYSQFDKIIAISPEMKLDLLRKLNINQDNIDFIYNPIDLDSIKHKANEKVNIDYPYFIQVSRLVEGKGHEELIEIYAELKNKGLEQKLIFVGDGDNRKVLEQKIAALDLADDVYLIGNRDNPYPYIKNATLFLHTSEHEGLPTVLLESLALGVPVVAMDCPTGPKDILGNSEYGVLVELHNKQKFIDSVLSLVNNPNKYAYYSTQGPERASKFSLESIAEDVSKLFRQIVKKEI